MSKRLIILAACGVSAAIGSLFGSLPAGADDHDHVGETIYPMSQAAFPCEEDEVLGYGPESTEYVYCQHVDTIGG